MKNIIIAPDSFKGTFSATEVCEIISSVLLKKYSDIRITEIPIADGGEGTVDGFLHAMGGEKVSVKVKSPLMGDIDACYGRINENIAVIETAQASGLTIEKMNDPILASTYGTGQLIRHAIEQGAKEIYLGLGGSATTDAGLGMLMALGGRLYDSRENLTESFDDVRRIDLTEVGKLIKSTEIIGLCDVKNPLYGKNGAAYIFSPQKGANSVQVSFLDERLKNISMVAEKALNKDYSQYEGAGAAGGLGFAVLAFLNGRLQSGIDSMLDAVEFEKKAKLSDMIITGEGKMDSQSLMGKVPFGVAKRSMGKKVIAVVGINENDISLVREKGIDEVIETNYLHKPFSEIKPTAKEDLIIAAEKIEI